MKNSLVVLVSLFVAFFAFGSFAYAQDGMAVDPFGLIASIVESVQAGQWRLVASGALVLTMLALNKFRDKIPFLSGDRGGAIAVMVLALGGAIASALATSTPMSVGLFLGAAGVAWTAVGGWQWAKRLVSPQD